jgi:hypothetical protein
MAKKTVVNYENGALTMPYYRMGINNIGGWHDHKRGLEVIRLGFKIGYPGSEEVEILVIQIPRRL